MGGKWDGSIYEDKGEYDRAISDFNKALEINPMYAEAYNNRGIAYYHKEEWGGKSKIGN